MPWLQRFLTTLNGFGPYEDALQPERTTTLHHAACSRRLLNIGCSRRAVIAAHLEALLSDYSGQRTGVAIASLEGSAVN